MKKDKYVKICPKCGSIEINTYTKWGSIYGEALIEHCEKCNYSGFIPEVNEAKIIYFRRELKNNEKEDKYIKLEY